MGRIGVLLSVLGLLLLAAGCAAKRPAAQVGVQAAPRDCPADEAAYSQLDQTWARAVCREQAFRRERQIINERLKQAQSPAAGTDAPKYTVGLALSGGGMRSNAFQLGLLSGLHTSQQLKNVSYLSSVSGGSWAAGAYKIYSGEDAEFFQGLDRAVAQDSGFYRCEDFSSPQQKEKCASNRYVQYLLNSYCEITPQLVRTLPLLGLVRMDYGYSTRENWHGMVLDHFVGQEKDVLLSDLEDKNEKPFLILNGTHDTTDIPRDHPNLPYQMTGFSIGTIADCGTVDSCKPGREAYQGFFQRYDQSNAKKCPLSVSHAMTISSAVWSADFGQVMSWNVPVDREAVQGLPGPHRQSYVLTDGGHSENTGALALLERGVDLVVMADASFDAKRKFGDYAMLKQQARLLLDTDIRLYSTNGKDLKHSIQDCKTMREMCSDADNELKELDKNEKDDYVMYGSYCDRLKLTGEKYAPINIIYARAPENIQGFLEYIRSSDDYRYIYQYLVLNKTDFPNDPTAARRYDRRLIFAYYLLGKYIATEQLAPILERALVP